MTLLVQSPKFGTVKTVTTSQSITITPTIAPTAGNTLVIGYSAISAGGVLSRTSIQSNLGANFGILQENTSGFTGLTGNAVLASIAPGTTSVTLVFGNTTSVNVSIDAEVYELTGSLAADVTGAHATTGNSLSFSFPYTTSAANDFAWCASGSNNSSAVLTPTNGWTIDTQPSVGNTGGFFSHLDGAVSGVTSFDGTVAPTSAWQWNIASMLAPVVTPPVPAQGPMPRRIFILP